MKHVLQKMRKIKSNNTSKRTMRSDCVLTLRVKKKKKKKKLGKKSNRKNNRKKKDKFTDMISTGK